MNKNRIKRNIKNQKKNKNSIKKITIKKNKRKRKIKRKNDLNLKKFYFIFYVVLISKN